MKTQDGANKMDTTKTYHWKIATPANVQKVADIGCDPVGIDHYSNPDDPGPVGNDRPASQVQYVKKGVGTLTPYARGNYLWSWDSGYGRGDMGFMASGTRSSLQASSTAGGHYSFRSHVKSANPYGGFNFKHVGINAQGSCDGYCTTPAFGIACPNTQCCAGQCHSPGYAWYKNQFVRLSNPNPTKGTVTVCARDKDGPVWPSGQDCEDDVTVIIQATCQCAYGDQQHGNPGFCPGGVYSQEYNNYMAGNA